MSTLLVRLLRRMRSSFELFRYFLVPDRFFLLPLVLLLLVAGALLTASAGLSRIAPFVYALF
jgi:hypothetical protein